MVDVSSKLSGKPRRAVLLLLPKEIEVDAHVGAIPGIADLPNASRLGSQEPIIEVLNARDERLN